MTALNKVLIVIFIFSVMSVMATTKNNKPNIVFTIIIIIILTLVSGLRTRMGDTYFYMHSYKIIGAGQYDKESDGYEKGWVIFCEELNKISKDPQFMLLVTSFIVVVCVIFTLRDYSSLFVLQIYLYITTGCYIASMNGIRQCVVAAILFWLVRFVIKGKFIPYCMLSLLLMNFHESAFIMIPVYFIVRLEAWTPKTIKFMICGIIGVLCFNELSPYITNILGNSSYSSYLENPEDGANIIRVIISAVPVVLSYLYKDDIKKRYNYADVFINMSILNFMVMGLATFNWVFARFNLYFELYNIILIPCIISSIPKITEKRLIYYIAIICYGVFYIIESRSWDFFNPYL